MDRKEIKEKIRYRDFRPEDFPDIQRLWEITGMGDPERDDNPAVIKECNDLGGKFIVMLIHPENKIIGTSWMSCDGRRTFLHHFCIDPEYQGLGLGEMLGYESLKFLKEIGKQVKLEVHKKNKKAKNLYKKLGFFAFEDYDIFMIRNLDGI